MIISNLAVLLAERKCVADLVRSTGINKSTLHKLYNDESDGLILKPLIKFVLLDVSG
jgi:putative transcriptional regulator